MLIRTVMGTGHRPQYLPGGWGGYIAAGSELIQKLTAHIVSMHKEYGLERVITGMAQGWDTLLGIAAVRARRHVPVQLVAAVPCVGQESRWSPGARELYRRLLDEADQVYYVFPGRYEQNRGCMHERDEYMVRNSDAVLAYYLNLPYGLHSAAEMRIPARDKGGTVYTLRFARKWAIENDLYIPVFNYCRERKVFS
ncbi:MAG: SLOG family protein [Desulfofundulus sp.]